MKRNGIKICQTKPECAKNYAQVVWWLSKYFSSDNDCPKSLVNFYIVICYIKRLLGHSVLPLN